MAQSEANVLVELPKVYNRQEMLDKYMGFISEHGVKSDLDIVTPFIDEKTVKIFLTKSEKIKEKAQQNKIKLYVRKNQFEKFKHKRKTKSPNKISKFWLPPKKVAKISRSFMPGLLYSKDFKN